MNRLSLLVAALLASVAVVCVAEDQVPTLALGASAPDFSLTGVDDRTYTLKDFAGAKFLVVVFTCNHCPTAQHYEERIKAMVTEYKDKGVAFVAINPNDPKALRLDELGWSDMGDSFAEMKIRARDHHFNFPYLYDGDTETVSRAYGPVATPHAFIFDGERKLRYVGGVDDAERVDHVTKHYVHDALDALLAGKEPPVTKSKVPGCSTKWASKEASAQAFLDKVNAEPVSLSLADTNVMRELRQNKSGKFRLVNFWATTCAPCMVEFPELVTINQIYRIRDFEFVSVAINQPDEEKTVLSFLKKRHASNRNLLFGSPDREPLINAFDPAWQGEVPYTVLIDPEGKVIYREVGSIDVLAVKRAIAASLRE